MDGSTGGILVGDVENRKYLPYDRVHDSQI